MKSIFLTKEKNLKIFCVEKEDSTEIFDKIPYQPFCVIKLNNIPKDGYKNKVKTLKIKNPLLANFLPMKRRYLFLCFCIFLIFIFMFGFLKNFFSIYHERVETKNNYKIESLSKEILLKEHHTPFKGNICNNFNKNITNLEGDNVLLFEYIQFHNQELCKNSKDLKFLIHLPLAGLGNRIQSIISSFTLAMLTNRIFLFDLSHSGFLCQEDDLFFNDSIFYNINILYHHSKIYRDLSFKEFLLKYSKILHFHSPLDDENISKLFCEKFEMEEKIIFIETDEYYLPLMLHNPFYKDILRNSFKNDIFGILLRFLLKPNLEILKMMDNFQCDLGLQMRTKGLNGPRDLNYFLNLFNNCSMNFKRDNVYIASDSDEMIDEFKKRNLNLNFKFQKYYKSSFDPCVGIKRALVDILYLSKCNNLITTSWSSFAFIAQGYSSKIPWLVGHINDKNEFTGSEVENDRNTCKQLDFSHPCYFEFSHVKHLSCFKKEVFENEKCCSIGLCNDYCIHHYKLEYNLFQWFYLNFIKYLLPFL